MGLEFLRRAEKAAGFAFVCMEDEVMQEAPSVQRTASYGREIFANETLAERIRAFNRAPRLAPTVGALPAPEAQRSVGVTAAWSTIVSGVWAQAGLGGAASGARGGSAGLGAAA